MPPRFSAARRSLVLSAAFAPLAPLVLAACSKPYVFHGVDITGVPYADGFSLTDFNGKTRTLADFAGKVVVMYFGYTQCPDICPASMQVVAQALDDLGEKARDVQFLFVTVDPERDTPEILKAYVTHFNPTFLALTGTPAQIALTAKDFKVYYKKCRARRRAATPWITPPGFMCSIPRARSGCSSARASRPKIWHRTSTP
jgi:Uncharacterized protein SCO1/SenC/PrrC, involved in biogenesis of respiratory and photosynthetic systems